MTSSKQPTPTKDTEPDPQTTIAIQTEPLEQTILWLLEGVRLADIKTALAKAYPSTDADTLIQAVAGEFEKSADADGLVLLGWCLEAYRELYRRSVEIGDFPAAMRAVKELMVYSVKCLQARDQDD